MTPGKPSPQFSMEHRGEIFSSKDEREALGFTPLDLFLAKEVPDDGVFDPRTVFYGEDGDELIEDIEEGNILVCRYKNEGFNMDEGIGVPWDVEAYPAFQRELHPASVAVDDNFRGLMQIIDESFEGFETDYMYKFKVEKDSLEEGNHPVHRFTDTDDYMDYVSHGPVTVWPETLGINSVTVHPQSFTAVIHLYQQEVTVPPEEDELRKKGIGSGDYWETVRLNYDEEPIEDLEAGLERQGLRARRDYMPRTTFPEEIR